MQWPWMLLISAMTSLCCSYQINNTSHNRPMIFTMGLNPHVLTLVVLTLYCTEVCHSKDLKFFLCNYGIVELCLWRLHTSHLVKTLCRNSNVNKYYSHFSQLLSRGNTQTIPLINSKYSIKLQHLYIWLYLVFKGCSWCDFINRSEGIFWS